MEKIINIGAHKTGTSSLFSALGILGYKNSPEWFYQNERGNFFKYVKGKKGTLNLYNYIMSSEFNLYEDSPYNFKKIYKELFQMNNNFKFILTIREENEWFDSLLNSLIVKINFKDNITLQYLYGDVEEANKDKIINIYNERNNEIIDYFKGNKNLCVINLSDNDLTKWKKLTDFLNIQEKFAIVKNLKYPYENKRKN